MSTSYWQDQSQQTREQVDITIVGGGVAGLSVLYWLLHEDPQLNIALVDKSYLGSGATGRNAGFITCGSVEHFNRLVGTHGKEKALKIWQFSEFNLKLLKEHIVQEAGPMMGFESKGSFSLASTDKEFEELKKSAHIMKELSISVEILEERDVQSRLHTTGFVGGIKYTDDASVHPLSLLKQIQHHALLLSKSSVQIYENEEVFRIEDSPEGQKIVVTPRRQITSDIIIYATNGYSRLLEPFFADKIYPTRGQILLTEPISSQLEGPCYANFVLDYFRQLPTGELIIGGFRQLQKDAEVGFSDETTPVIQSALEDFINTYLPFAQNKKITHRWSGVMGFSRDGQPLVGSLPHDPQSFFSAGFTAHGLGLAFHCGKALVDLMYEREIPEFISAKRF